MKEFALEHPYLVTFLVVLAIVGACNTIKVVIRGWPPHEHSSGSIQIGPMKTPAPEKGEL